MISNTIIFLLSWVAMMWLSHRWEIKNNEIRRELEKTTRDHLEELAEYNQKYREMEKESEYQKNLLRQKIEKLNRENEGLKDTMGKMVDDIRHATQEDLPF